MRNLRPVWLVAAACVVSQTVTMPVHANTQTADNKPRQLRFEVASVTLAWLLGLLILAAVTCTGQGQSQQVVLDRPKMAKELVQRVFEMPAGFNLGFHEQAARILGESVAVAVMQSVRLKDLDDSGNRERVTLLLEQAFSEPWMIVDPGDRFPGATLFLLDCLAQLDENGALAARLRKLTSKLDAAKSER